MAGAEVQVAVVVDDGPTAYSAHLFEREARFRGAARLGEAATGGVVEQQVPLRLHRPRAKLGRIYDLPIGGREIETRVIVDVEEQHAKPDEWKRREAEAALTLLTGSVWQRIQKFA